jgi:hypothetical protein
MSAAAPAVAPIDNLVLDVLGRRADLNKRGVPDLDDVEILAEAGQVDALQWECADELLQRGLTLKARRRALCGVVGSRYRCSDTTCRREYYVRFRCRVRYCSACGPRMFRQLHRKYAALEDVTARLRRENPRHVLAKLDGMAVNLQRMPKPADVRVFKRAIGKLVDRICKKLRVKRKQIGLIYALEFGSRNSNLHFHGLFCGPRLPKPRVHGRQGELSRWWEEACRGTVFEGSRIISIKQAGNFHAALGHCLKYPTKFLTCSSASRLADLEAVFHGARRVSTLGAFYNAVKHAAAASENGLECPYCRAALHKEGAWWPVPVLRREGLMELEEARSAVARAKQGWEAAAPCRGSPGSVCVAG